jgi:polysaccharide pyruvyl transferase CsaB
VHCLHQCDLLISGGGSLLQDSTSTRNPFYYLAVIFLAKLMDKPIIVYAQGIGPLRNRLSRFLTAWLLNGVHLITVRDQSSKRDLQKMGVEAEIMVTADPVLGLSSDSISDNSGREILARNGLKPDPEQKVLGVFIRAWEDSSFLVELVKACDLLSEDGWKIVFIPMQFPRDVVIAKETAKLMQEESLVLKELYSPAEILSITKNLNLVIGMRLHALIMAAVVGVPMIGLSYDPKVERFLQQIGQHCLISVKDLKAQNLVDMTSWVVSHSSEISEDLSKNVQPLYKKAWQTARLAMNLLQQ